MGNDDVDDLDELELIDQYELEEDQSEGTHSGSDADSEDEEAAEAMTEEQYNQLKFTVVNIVTAMGGLEEVMGKKGEVEMHYVLGDDCLRCLRDLRKLWRQDEDDHHRVIPKIYAELNVLQTGLLPLLLKTTDMGEKGQKISLACTDLITTITWPIDLAAEQQAAIQREDEDGSAMSTIQVLETAFVSYKSAVLRTRSRETNGSQRSVLSSIMLLVLLPSLSKPRHQRTERDIGTISMCLHLFRNLLAIRDPAATSLSSPEDITNSMLQSHLVVELESSRVLDAILMLTSNADLKDFNDWNIVAFECVFHIFAGTKPDELIVKGKPEEPKSMIRGKGPVRPASTGQQSELTRLLAAEEREELASRKLLGSTRHSRFNTMINFIDKNGNRRMALGQAALRKTVEELTMEADAKGKRAIHRRKAFQEKGAVSIRAPWTPQAIKVLRVWAEKLLKMGFESLTRSVLEDVRRERPKVGDLDTVRTRIMQLGSFFLDYFLQQRQASHTSRSALIDISNEDGEVEAEAEADAANGERNASNEEWPFALVGQWLEPWALRMAYVRSSSSFEKKRWLEYVAAIELWTTLFKLIDGLSKSTVKEDRNAAEAIQMTHFYDQAALDSAKSVLSSYTSQSLSCLRAIIHFAYWMPKMLERYSRDKDHMYVKAKQQVRKSKKDQNSLAEDEMEAREIAKNEELERKFEFQKFQGKMCSQNLADGCLLYLSRWKEFQDCPMEQVCFVTQVLHRLAIKAGDYKLFFPYKRRLMLKKLQLNHLFWSFIQSEAPQMESDVRKLIDYILRKFNKMTEEEQSKWGEGMGLPRPIKVFKMPCEIEIKPSRGHLDDMGIAIGLLLEKDKMRSIMWVKSGLEEAIRVKQAIVAEERELNEGEDDNDDNGDDDDDDDRIPASALSRFADFELPYDGDDELRTEASTSPELKLLCRLLGLKSDENDSLRWVWVASADALPHELVKEVELIEDFLRRPLDTFGETYESMVQRVRKVIKRPVRKIVNEHGDEEEVIIQKGRGRRKEKQPDWVENDFIEDSDEELEMIARMIASRGGQEGETSVGDTQQQQQQSSPSGSSLRGRSTTGSSNRHASSPPSSHRGSTPKQTRKPRSTALFLGSDDDDDDGEGNDDDAASPARSPLAFHLKRPAPRPSKRAFVSSDEEEGQGRAEAHQGERDLEGQEEQSVQRNRKRRALINDDEED